MQMSFCARFSVSHLRNSHCQQMQQQEESPIPYSRAITPETRLARPRFRLHHVAKGSRLEDGCVGIVLGFDTEDGWVAVGRTDVCEWDRSRTVGARTRGG